MKKIVLALVMAFGSLYATSGGDIYKSRCMACHGLQSPMSVDEMKSMRQKMQSASKEEKMLLKEQMMQKMKKAKMRAPAMPMVSMRLKSQLKDKKAFIAFVTDYIQNPSQEKGHCMPMAYKRFGTMPPIGRSLTPEQRTAVATWLYENFKGSWAESMGGKSCEMRNKMKEKSMKCGSGKCGGAKKASNSSTKCGAVAIPTH